MRREFSVFISRWRKQRWYQTGVHCLEKSGQWGPTTFAIQHLTSWLDVHLNTKATRSALRAITFESVYESVDALVLANERAFALIESNQPNHGRGDRSVRIVSLDDFLMTADRYVLSLEIVYPRLKDSAQQLFNLIAERIGEEDIRIQYHQRRYQGLLEQNIAVLKAFVTLSWT